MEYHSYKDSGLDLSPGLGDPSAEPNARKINLQSEFTPYIQFPLCIKYKEGDYECFFENGKFCRISSDRVGDKGCIVWGTHYSMKEYGLHDCRISFFLSKIIQVEGNEVVDYDDFIKMLNEECFEFAVQFITLETEKSLKKNDPNRKVNKEWIKKKTEDKEFHALTAEEEKAIRAGRKINKDDIPQGQIGDMFVRDPKEPDLSLIHI